jgi:hypothetical protein
MISSAQSLYDVFLSYGREDDLPFVEKLYADLSSNNYTVWFDKESLESNGLSFLQSIKDSIARNPIRLLLVVGPHASKSDFVRYEYEFALANCMVIIPLLRLGIEKDENGNSKMSNTDYNLIPAPIKQRNLHCIDFRRDRPYNDALKELLCNLEDKIKPLGQLHSVPNKPANFIDRDE